jgi:hypothetical protein
MAPNELRVIGNRIDSFGTLDVQARYRELERHFMNQISWPTPTVPLAPAVPSVPSTQRVGKHASLIRQALSLPQDRNLQANARRSSPGSDFIDKVTSVFEKICTDLNKELDAINDVQRERQAAMLDLFAVRDALAKYRLNFSDPKQPLDLAGVEIVVSQGSPLASGGINTVKLTAVMDYYRKEHSEIGMPRTPETAGELESYLDHIDIALKMVLEPASQEAHTEMERLTQQSRAMEQLQAMLYQLYYDALRKFTNAS